MMVHLFWSFGDFSIRTELAGRVKSCWVWDDGAEGYGVGGTHTNSAIVAPEVAGQCISNTSRLSVVVCTPGSSGGIARPHEAF